MFRYCGIAPSQAQLLRRSFSWQIDFCVSFLFRARCRISVANGCISAYSVENYVDVDARRNLLIVGVGYAAQDMTMRAIVRRSNDSCADTQSKLLSKYVLYVCVCVCISYAFVHLPAIRQQTYTTHSISSNLAS